VTPPPLHERRRPPFSVGERLGDHQVRGVHSLEVARHLLVVEVVPQAHRGRCHAGPAIQEAAPEKKVLDDPPPGLEAACSENRVTLSHDGARADEVVWVEKARRRAEHDRTAPKGALHPVVPWIASGAEGGRCDE
jgi:hypothetical protein